MRLERLDLVPYSLPFREPYVTARGELRERQLLLVRLRSTEGVEGLGEGAPLALRGGPGLEQIARELEEVCWPVVRGQDVAPDRLWAAIAACRGRGASRQALAALDIALHDLAAKSAGIPLWQLLGAGTATPVPCNATLPAGNPTTLERLAKAWAERGFTTFKLKVGIAGDVAQVAKVRAVLGHEARIRVDANAAWRVDEAVKRLRAMAVHRLELVEQPVGSLEGLSEVRRRTGLKIAADESVVDERDARRAAESRACDMATVKLAKAGGIGATLAVAAQLPVYLSSALDGPVGIAAAGHAAQVLPHPAGVAHGLATGELFDGTIAARQPSLEDSSLTLPDDPGLGVEIDEQELARRRL